ncbi:MAG: adenylate/guanylate cyclase domain-containing protein [Acidimicrobiales bacterium]
MECPNCRADIAADARFCSNCGHETARRHDERRVVTVLFADIVGFTGLSETRDPEQVKNLVDRCFALLADDITAFGGRVDKVIGDAIVALFGAPIAHEDDAERAVRAALRMQETVQRFDAETGVGIRVRIGVNTGEVLVGAIAAGDDYTAMGDVVNTAPRLQTSAEPGTVLVGAETYRATTEVIHYRSIGQLHARGREEPVAAYRALEPVGRPGNAARARRSR